MTSAREPTTAGPFGGDGVRHEAEHAAGGEVDKLDYLLALLTGGEDARAEEDSNDDNGQHVGARHGLEEVVRGYAGAALAPDAREATKKDGHNRPSPLTLSRARDSTRS